MAGESHFRGKVDALAKFSTIETTYKERMPGACERAGVACRNANAAAFSELRNDKLPSANIESIFNARKFCYLKMPIDVDDTCLWPCPAE